MGVRCNVLGHVHDTTELEERREERPNGTVLICREYQVCRRCGDRDELYRNEQLLARPEGETNTDGSGAEPSDVGASEVEAGASEDPSEAVTAGADGEGDERDPASEESVGETDSETGVEILTDESGDDSQQHVEADERAQDEAGDGVSDSDTETVSASGDTDEGSTTDDGVILSESSSEVATLQSGTDPAAERSGTESLTPGAGTETETAAADGGRDTGTAVGSASESWAVEVTTDDTEEVVCRTCGEKWDRDSTSLRDGDLCPDCRRGYVESL